MCRLLISCRTRKWWPLCRQQHWLGLMCGLCFLKEGIPGLFIKVRYLISRRWWRQGWKFTSTKRDFCILSWWCVMTNCQRWGLRIWTFEVLNITSRPMPFFMTRRRLWLWKKYFKKIKIWYRYSHWLHSWIWKRKKKRF